MPLYDRPQMQEILAMPDLVERTRAHAAFVTANNRRSSPLLRAMEGAAASEPGAADMLAEWAERRLRRRHQVRTRRGRDRATCRYRTRMP